MNKKILLIDDDVDEYYIFKESLAETGLYFECTYAEEVQAGIMSSRNSAPDFIFLDINLPRIDGFAGLALIKKNGWMRNIPIILYSSAISTDIENRAIAMGAYACIKKADTIKQLANTLKIFFLKALSLKEGQV